MAMTEINPQKVTSEELDVLRTLVHETLPEGDLKEFLHYLLYGLDEGKVMYLHYEE